MKRIVIALFVFLSLSLYSQSNDELNLNDITIEGEDEKTAEFHIVYRNLDRYELIDQPASLRYKYFSRRNELFFRESKPDFYRSYSELFLGTTSFIDFKTEFLDLNNSLLDFKASYHLRALSEDWKESSTSFRWSPAFKRIHSEVSAMMDEYTLSKKTNSLAGMMFSTDLSQIVEGTYLQSLNISGSLFQTDYNGKSNLYDISLKSTLEPVEDVTVAVNVLAQTGTLLGEGMIEKQGEKIDFSLWLAADKKTVIPSIGFVYNLDLGRNGHVRFANSPMVIKSSYADALSDYHYLDLSQDLTHQKRPLNASISYGNSIIIPFNLEINQSYYLDYSIIDPNNDSRYTLCDFPLLSFTSKFSYLKKWFHLSDETTYNVGKQKEINFVNGKKYNSIPYIPELENITKIDISVDKFVFSTVFVYKSGIYDHLNIELEPSYMLNWKAEYTLKQSVSFFIYLQNMLGFEYKRFSNYETEKLEFGIGTKISLK